MHVLRSGEMAKGQAASTDSSRSEEHPALGAEAPVL
jgi:hypothetical protein